MYWEGEKPDYEKKDIKVDIYPEFKIENNDNQKIVTLSDYLNKLKIENKNKAIKLNFYTEEEAEGFGYPTTYIIISPYYMRKETDEEYSSRIEYEETMYAKYQEVQRLKREQNEEYQKDMAEYKRIKEKYNFLW